MSMPTFDPEPEKVVGVPLLLGDGVVSGTDVPAPPFVTPLEAARSIVAEQYLAAQDREDQGRTSLKAAEDHHATCVDELNLLEDAHRALFPETPPAPAPDPVPVPAGANIAPRR